MSNPFEDLAELAVMIGGGVYVGWYLLSKARNGQKNIDAEWEEAARRLHGNTQSELSRNRRRTLRAALDGKVLLIVAESQVDRNSETHHVTLTSGPLTGLVPLTLHVAKRGILGRVAERLGVAEIATGDDAFHDELRVTGKPAGLAATFLDRRTRAQLREVAEEIAIEDGEVLLERDAYPEDADTLVNMAKYAGVLVERWNHLARAPKELAADLDLALTGAAEPLARGMRRGHEVTLSLRFEEEAAVCLAFGGEELVVPGLEHSATEVARALDERLDALPRPGGYR